MVLLKDRTHDATLRAILRAMLQEQKQVLLLQHFTQQLHRVSTPLHAMLHAMLHRVSGPLLSAQIAFCDVPVVNVTFSSLLLQPSHCLHGVAVHSLCSCCFISLTGHHQCVMLLLLLLTPVRVLVIQYFLFLRNSTCVSFGHPLALTLVELKFGRKQTQVFLPFGHPAQVDTS